MEDHDIAAGHVTVRQYPAQEAAGLAGGCVNLLIDEEKVAYQEGVFHALRGDEKGL
jgi:hypothetical protein